MALPDIFGDDIPIKKRFTANRSSRILTIVDFDAENTEKEIILNSGRIAKLLRWAVHTLEIFMWQEDYSLLPEPDFGFDSVSEDWEDDFGEDDIIFEEKENPSALPTEQDIRWRVDIEYSNHTTQKIVSYQNFLEDRPEELYYAMLEYFESDTE